jgi:hypothetical protein
VPEMHRFEERFPWVSSPFEYPVCCVLLQERKF